MRSTDPRKRHLLRSLRCTRSGTGAAHPDSGAAGSNNDFYNYTYDELEGLGHEWKFWDIELQKFLDYAGLPVVK